MSQGFTLQFSPTAVGPITAELRIRVASNPFEDYRVLLSGDGYQVRQGGPQARGRVSSSGWKAPNS
jgi:hypothetical protein